MRFLMDWQRDKNPAIAPATAHRAFDSEFMNGYHCFTVMPRLFDRLISSPQLAEEITHCSA